MENRAEVRTEKYAETGAGQPFAGNAIKVSITNTVNIEAQSMLISALFTIFAVDTSSPQGER